MNQFSTSDTFLSSAIVANSIPIDSMSKEKDGRVYFYFNREGNLLDQIVERYWNKTLHTDAQTLLMEHRILKQRIANI